MLWTCLVLCTNQILTCSCSRKTTGNIMPNGWQLFTSCCAYAPAFFYKECCKYPEIPAVVGGIALGATLPPIITIPFGAGIATGFTGFILHKKFYKSKQD